MILAPLWAVSLIATIATGPVGDHFGPSTGAHKGDALRATVRAATECVVRSIADDPRVRDGGAEVMLGELIVDSMPACAGRMRDMIKAYDASFGPGSGEAFFMGPYLKALPDAAGQWLKTDARVR